MSGLETIDAAAVLAAAAWKVGDVCYCADLGAQGRHCLGTVGHIRDDGRIVVRLGREWNHVTTADNLRRNP